MSNEGSDFVSNGMTPGPNPDVLNTRGRHRSGWSTSEVTGREVWVPDPLEREVPASAVSAITQAVVNAQGSLSQRMFIVDGLIAYLHDIEQPKLGLATTGQLIQELAARAEMNGYDDYRTVDHH